MFHFQTWKRRWFALKNRTLTYFKNDKEEIASIDLRTVTELRGPEHGGSFEAQCSFQIVTQERYLPLSLKLYFIFFTLEHMHFEQTHPQKQIHGCKH